MINLESLNYLNQRKVSPDDFKNKLLNNNESKFDKKDFKTILDKEKKGSRQIIEKPVDQKTITTDDQKVKPLNINEKAVNTINEKVEALKVEEGNGKLESVENLEPKETLELEETLEEVLVALSSLFINDSSKPSDLENLEELLITKFEELKNVVFESKNASKDNVNLLNIMTLTNSLEEVKASEVITFKDTLIEINDLLKEAVIIKDNIKNNVNTEELLNQLKSVEGDIKTEVANLFNTLDSEEFKGAIKGINNDEKQNLLNTIKSLITNTKGNEEVKENVSIPINESNIEVKTTIFNSEENNFNTLDNSYSEEDKILDKVINNNTENKLNTVLNNSYDRFNNITTKASQVPVYKETMKADIIQNVRYMVNNKIEELTVKIYPKELGEITIKLLSEEGIFRADIKATSKETYMLLNSNIEGIKNILSEQNIKIQEVNIGVYNEDTTFFSGKDDESKQSKNGKSSSNRIEGIESEEVIEESLIDSNINLLA